jgi:hypothetical protein
LGVAQRMHIPGLSKRIHCRAYKKTSTGSDTT